MQLAPCPGCARHVRADDSCCPFCGASVEGITPKRARVGLTRLAIFGAALLAPAAVGCGGGSASTETETTVVEESPPPDEQPPPDETAGGEEGEEGEAVEGPTVHTMYGGPPAD